VKLVIREKAFADLERIHAWIAEDSPENARSVVRRICDAMEEKILAFPYIGRLGRVEDTREWVVRGLPYIIVYQADDVRDVLTVLAVFHAAQNR